MEEKRVCELCKKVFSDDELSLIESCGFHTVYYVCNDCIENQNAMICDYCGRVFSPFQEESVMAVKSFPLLVKCQRCLMAERQSRVIKRFEVRRNILEQRREQ